MRCKRDIKGMRPAETSHTPRTYREGPSDKVWRHSFPSRAEGALGEGSLVGVQLLGLVLLRLLGRGGVHVCLLWTTQRAWAGRGCPRRLSGCEFQSLGEIGLGTHTAM